MTGTTTETIHRLQDGLILDCGAGRRPIYYSNVVNFEIVAYDTTDVRGVGESLPFETDSFDAVFSFAVLEHVKDPFRCASEICRVLKPGDPAMRRPVSPAIAWLPASLLQHVLSRHPIVIRQ